MSASTQNLAKRCQSLTSINPEARSLNIKRLLLVKSVRFRDNLALANKFMNFDIYSGMDKKLLAIVGR